jgi:flavin-dependent dehydrogenase
MEPYEVIIVGGGLAGLTAALHLATEEFRVLVIEKEPYPRHRVCGEYLSREVLPYLSALGVSLGEAKPIGVLQLSTHSGRFVETPLPMGGLGISRYALDYTLYKKALQAGAAFVFGSVEKIDWQDEKYIVNTEIEEYRANIVIGAYGKRALLDKELDRDFIGHKSPWLAIKAHYNFPQWPDDMVGLHAFPGGYAGLSKTETGAVNFCYLASYASFKQHGNIEAYNQNVVASNPILGDFLSEARMVFKQPLSIAQVSFYQKTQTEHGMLMCGDSAGLIHPLCGNGMAMAVHSAKLAVEAVINHRRRKDKPAKELTQEYQTRWKATFAKRMAIGRQLQSLLLNQRIAALMMAGVARSPAVLRAVIRTTHGKEVAL